MLELAPHRPSFLRPLDAGLLVVGAAILGVVILASSAFAADAGEALTRNTVRLSLGWYFAALLIMMRLDRGDWPATAAAGRLARWCWTWGLVCFAVHVGMAFHCYHHWSPADAFERTRQISGLGEGIYFSYLFAVVWAADAATWWLAPAKYAARSRWFDRALHAYMLFMVANGMIVYETGPIRWAGVVMFIILPAAWLLTRFSPRWREQ
ncbi:MAG TPA: hypothetical protein VGY55_22385 [Pirellulales bacterium]|nr:hypothetical protein [Pirellulales bacterium]